MPYHQILPSQFPLFCHLIFQPVRALLSMYIIQFLLISLQRPMIHHPPPPIPIQIRRAVQVGILLTLLIPHIPVTPHTHQIHRNHGHLTWVQHSYQVALLPQQIALIHNLNPRHTTRKKLMLLCGATLHIITIHVPHPIHIPQQHGRTAYRLHIHLIAMAQVVELTAHGLYQ